MISHLIYDNFFSANFKIIYRMRVKCGKSRKKLDIDELKEFIEIHSLDPEEDDTPYIVAHIIEETGDFTEGGQPYFVNILI